jgi:hypothetical protein
MQGTIPWAIKAAAHSHSLAHTCGAELHATRVGAVKYLKDGMPKKGCPVRLFWSFHRLFVWATVYTLCVELKIPNE